MLSTILRACLGSIVFVCLLSGCGGGGGGGAPESNGTPADTVTPVPPPAPATALVTGSAVKGVIGNATISVYTINTAGSRGALLAETTTGADGSYNVQINAQNTPLWVELSANANAFMVCDALQGCGATTRVSFDTDNDGIVDFGESMPLDAGFTLRALLPSAENGTVSATISPLTHLAATLAELYPQGIDGLSIAMANSQVANLFALDTDILTTDVPDITDATRMQNASEGERKYAMVLGAFAALNEEGDFVTLLEQVTLTFAALEGQLPVRPQENGAVSLLQLAQKALEMAEYFNDPALASAFMQLKSLAELEPGDVTQSIPNENITSNETTAARALLSNVKSLKGTLDITQTHAPLPPFFPLLGASEQLAETTEILSWAGQYGAFVALPKLALETACNSISNYLTAYLCRSLIATKSLEEICTMTLSNLSIGGKTLCEYLNALRLPIGNGLVAELALMDGVATLTGEHAGNAVDMTLERGVTSNNSSVTLDWFGAVTNDEFSLDISGGSVGFVFDNLTTLSSLNHPRSITSQFAADIHFAEYQASNFSGTVNASVNLADEENPITSAQLQGTYLDGVGATSSINLLVSLQADFSAILSASFAHPESGQNVNVSLTHSLNGDTARFQWGGNTVNVVTDVVLQQVSLDNGTGIALVLDNSRLEGVVGSLTYNGKPYGDAMWVDGELIVTLPNGQSEILFTN